MRSKITIYAALIANILIAVVKFIAGAISGSSAMLSEAIHSVVDTINELLLLWGIHKSTQPRDDKRPFGYGRELFFWSFIVSMLIFGLGGGLSVYQGISHIIHPNSLGNTFWNFIVLGASVIFEGSSFLIAAIAFNKIRNGQSWGKAIHNSKDPTDFIVLFEDGTAVIGLFIVIICTWAGPHYGIAWLDGFASVLVGLLLISASFVIAKESRSLLMGEGVATDTKRSITRLINKDEAVNKMNRQFSIYMGPDEVLLIIDICFFNDLDTTDLTNAIDRIRKKIQEKFPKIKYLIIQPV